MSSDLGAAVASLKLDEMFPASGWAAMQRAQIITARSIDMEHFARLDHLLTAPVNELTERTDATSSPRGQELLALLRGPSITNALAALGANKRYIQAVADDRRAVTFFTIRNVIESACVKGALNPDSLLYSVVGARVLARSLTEETHHHGG